MIAFSSGAAHFDFEGSLNKLCSSGQCEAISAILVSDAETAWFIRDNGVGDSFGPVVSLLRVELERRRPQKLLVIGYCRGAYAAVRAGVELGADKILAFSPQCFIHPQQRRELSLPPAYFDEMLEALHRADAPLESLASVLRRTDLHEGGSLGTEVALHVGGDAVGDAREVALLLAALEAAQQQEEVEELAIQPAALPARGGLVAVTSHVHAGCGHELPLALKGQGLLLPLLREWLTVNTDTDTG